MDIKFMERALELAQECTDFDEVPVGAVLVKNGEIIAEGCNRKERENNAICHAEINVLADASRKLGNWWLEDCELYVTLEPCAMCAGALINARIAKLYFGAYDSKTGACGSKINILQKDLFNHNIEVEGGILKEESAKILSDFFKKKRKQKANKSTK
ncbi:MAG: tRNA adenosine(34) deaminase TadA [Clostridia bacterium]